MKRWSIGLAVGIGLALATPAFAQDPAGGPTTCNSPGPSGRFNVIHPAKPISVDWRGATYPVTGSVWKNESEEQLGAMNAAFEAAAGAKLRSFDIGHGLPTAVRAIGDGVLVAMDGGEWGGGTWFIRKGSAPVKLINKNTTTVFELGGKVYALTGLAHMIMDDGALWRLDISGATPSATHVAVLPGAPRAWSMADDKAFLMMTADGAVAILPDGTTEPAEGKRECTALEELR